MLKYTCENCEKEFSSEIDLENHQTFEAVMCCFEDIRDRIGWVSSELNMTNILTIMKNEHATFAEALEKYYQYNGITDQKFEKSEK